MNQVIKKRLHYRVVVTLKDGQAFVGVLWETDKQALILRDAAAVSDQREVGVDGELLLLWADVMYIQRP